MGDVEHAAEPDHGADLLAIYDDAVQEVYAYLRSRCGGRALAEDLTADTFLAAVGQIQRKAVERVTTAWLIGIARHKLVDHWRRAARRLESESLPEPAAEEDPAGDGSWDEVLDRHHVGVVMAELGPHHRSALTLRYYDGLPVPDVANHLGRTVDATEALLVRARRAFRNAYEQRGGAT